MGYEGPFEVDRRVRAFLKRGPEYFIEGRRVASPDAKRLPVFDPSSGLRIAEIGDATPDDVDRAVQSAHKAFVDGRWRNMRPADREKVLFRFAQLIEEQSEPLAQLETLEQGKSINLSRILESGASSEWMRYAAGLATKLTGRSLDLSLPPGPQHWTAFTRHEPVGVVGAIVPWNFPMLIAVWKIAPALAAGCSLVLKPSEVTPLSALWLAELAIEAGVPEGVFNVITGTGAGAGNALVTHPLVRKVSFTGSTATGKTIGHAALDRMVPAALELGGKNPAIVLADADVAATAAGLMLGGFLNQGQVCAAASRVYVEAAVYDDLVGALGSAIGAMTIGPGLDPSAAVNPLASRAHQAKVEQYIAEARAQNISIVEGIRPPEDGEGYYVGPKLILNPAEAAGLVRDELFGPVVNIIAVADREEAVHRANDSLYGLTASIWTRDLEAAMTLSRQVEAGTVWVNSHNLIDPNMPFGGIKQSGIGRDFGPDWLASYSEIKSICIAH